MRIFDIISKKRDGHELNKEEINFFIDQYVDGNIADYQASALLMAIYIKGMSNKETATLTEAMANSGDIVDLSSIDGIKVDKHSTGGVGDKTTLVIAPIVAACGGKVAKMSGRGLGHTGGTVDKLEAIPNFQTSLETEKFFEIVNKVGVSVIGQSGNLAPADKKLYALRDVTATIDCLPLIASSIMSKKIAAGSDCILLDVKTGSGAFMKTLDDSILLAEAMVAIGTEVGRKTTALITNMDIPLGFAIGNSLEVIESINTLKGIGPKDLTDVCIELATNMLVLSEKGTEEQCKQMVLDVIENGKALECLKDMVEAQGGDVSVIEDTENFKKAMFSKEILAVKSGYITEMDTEKCGIASVQIGAGRLVKTDEIDFSAGIVLNKKYGDIVKAGDVLATLYSDNKPSFSSAEALIQEAIIIGEKALEEEKLIYAKVTSDGVEKY